MKEIFMEAVQLGRDPQEVLEEKIREIEEWEEYEHFKRQQHTRGDSHDKGEVREGNMADKQVGQSGDTTDVPGRSPKKNDKD